MPSIFTRSRTASTPAKSQSKSNNGTGSTLPPNGAPDEFGRVTSRSSTVNSPLTKKDKKKDTKANARPRTHSSTHDSLEAQPLPDGSFLPFSWSPQDTQEEPRLSLQSYGYHSYQNEVILGLEEVTRLVEVITNEISQRGLTTPLLFSNRAFDISPPRIKRLIDAFLRTCSNHRPGSQADQKWREEAQFSGPHELAMTLRWGLARIVRIFQGQETRGILSWETYLRWREDEAAALYPAQYYQAFLPALPPRVQVLLTTLMAFLARLTAHATSSGLTPPALSGLFGPLLFGLGSATLPFHHTYGAYLRCSHATEHVLLSFIRTQDAATSRAVGTPSRLKDWIRGYPAMIPPMEKLDKARRGARTVRVINVRRNVRLYSTDLIKTAASWAAKGERGDISTSKEWVRIMGPPNAKLVPQYSEAYRKRLDLPPRALPDMGLSLSHSQSSSTLSSGSSLGSDDFSLLGKEEEKRFRSLTDLKWREFESLGFGGGDEKRLEFDLNEGARMARPDKRTTLTWSDFSTAGFSRNDAPLSATLQFSAPLTTTISAWPTRQSEIQNKIKKTQKALPAFGWDTSPVLGGEEAIEEGFLDVFCDLLYGSGWVDRREQTFRECNWALVEYKCMPQTRPDGPPPADPRTGASLWLYEEFIPIEYRSQLTAPKRKIPFSFATSSKKQWKPAATLNGRPYVVGGVPRTPNAREVEFEGLLNGGNVTKVISLGLTQTESRLESARPGAVTTGRTGMASSPAIASTLREAPASPAISTSSVSRRSRFLPGGTIRKHPPAEYDALEFETRTMFPNLSDEDVLSGDDKDPRRSKSSMGHNRRESKDDAWVDILVGAQKRMNEQAAELRTPGRRGIVKQRSFDGPEHAREEIAQALKAAGPVPPDEDYSLSIPQEELRESTASPSDEDVYGAPEEQVEGGRDVESSTRDSMESADFEPVPHMRTPSQDSERMPPASPLAHSRTESGLLPPSLQLNLGRQHHPGPPLPPVPVQVQEPVAPPATPPKAGVPGKGVSSLIEMYRERERESLQHSRIPVRSVPGAGAGAGTGVGAGKTVPVPPEPEREPSPPLPVPPVPPVVVVDEDPFVGRVSPAAPRYVHGAPLHNVVEAPEEEDDL